MMSKITAVPSSPSGRVISIGCTACPASLALLSMSAISFLVLVVVRCSPWIRPTVDTQAPWPQSPDLAPDAVAARWLHCRQGPCAQLGCADLAGTQPSATYPAQSLPCLLLAVLGRLLQLPTLGLATAPVGVGMLFPGPPVTAPA